MNEAVLIFEVDAARARALLACSQAAGFIPEVAATGNTALNRARERVPAFSLLVLGPGLSVHSIAALLSEMPMGPQAPPAVAVLHDATPDLITRLMRAGASEVLSVSAGNAALKAAMQRAVQVARMCSDISRIKGYSQACVRIDDLAGTGEDMGRVIALGERAARMRMHVLLEGELGAGKRLLARAVHAGSDRAVRPFIEVNCREIVAQDAEATLFDRRNGLFWAARSGTLFLNEIDVLPHGAQVRTATLMEAPQRKSSGIFEEHKPEVRVIASASRDMLALVKTGAFREDLFYRLNICPIWLPPLRRRREDIAALARGFMRAFALETGRRIDALSPEAADLLARYEWPGNLFELEREVFRAVLLAEKRELALRHFPRVQALAGLPEPQTMPRIDEPWALTLAQGSHKGKGGLLIEGMPMTPLASDGDSSSVGIPALTERGEVRSLEEIEADMIRLALGRYRGSMTEAARRLGIGRSTLYRKIREFGLQGRGGGG